MNTPLLNDRLLRAMLREPVDRTPVWIMRQAGRYLPEYRQVRERAGDFMTLCKTPELACQVTLQPLARFPLDAAILFSDILTIPDAMGLGLHFVEGEGPRFKQSLQTAADIRRLAPPVMDELRYVFDAVSLIRRELAGRVPLIGFAGSPWTLACYMVEGGSSSDFSRIRSLLYDQPELLHHLLNVLALTITDYLNEQIAAGAQAVQIFDTWGGLLTSAAYREFSLAYAKKIIAGLRREHEGRRVPVVWFTKNGHLLEDMAGAGCDVLGLDWTADLTEARRRVGGKVALQGNLDPAVLRAKPSVIRGEVAKILANYGKGSGHVFNLGHGITPDVPVEHAAELVNAVVELSPAYH